MFQEILSKYEFLAGRENKIISQMNISPHLGVVDDLFFSKPNYRPMQLYL